MFESGAIALYVAEKSEKLLPSDRIERERASAWVFAALNSVEIWIQQLASLDFFHAKEEWTKEWRPQIEKMVRDRLGMLEKAFDGKDYLEGTFTVGDLMMADVLRILDHTELLDTYPRLSAYKRRCEARPAFQRAMKAQIEGFRECGLTARPKTFSARAATMRPTYSQRAKASLNAAPATTASVVAGMTTVLSDGSHFQCSGLTRLCGTIEIVPSDLSARHQSMFLYASLLVL